MATTSTTAPVAKSRFHRLTNEGALNWVSFFAAFVDATAPPDNPQAFAADRRTLGNRDLPGGIEGGSGGGALGYGAAEDGIG